jgi:hypothetical protein
MKVVHQLDMGSERVSLGKLLEAQCKFNIPESATVRESEDDYTIIVEWEDTED